MTEEIEVPEGHILVETLADQPQVLMPSGEVVPLQDVELAPRQPDSLAPMELVKMALETGRNPEQLEKMLDLAERHAAEVARREFVQAMAGFRTEAVEIKKTRRVGYQNRDSTQTSYSHAELGGIVDAVVPALSKYGLAHRWTTHQGDGGRITVSCHLSHVGGHVEQSTLMAQPDTSGGKNAIQAIGSTITYLERYTLLAVTGLAAKGQDDDGDAAGEVGLSEQQVDELLKVSEECFGDRRDHALESLARRYFNIPDGNWTLIPLHRYPDAIRQLREKAEIPPPAPIDGGPHEENDNGND